MSDDREKLRTTLDELHAELASMEHVDDEVRELLASAVSDIDGALKTEDAGGDDEGGGSAEDSSIIHKLSEAARHYEDSHPTLSGIIGSIVDTLSRMGI